MATQTAEVATSAIGIADATCAAQDVVPKGGGVVSEEGQHAPDKLVAEAVSEVFVSEK